MQIALDIEYFISKLHFIDEEVFLVKYILHFKTVYLYYHSIRFDTPPDYLIDLR